MTAKLTFPHALIFDWDNTLVDSWEAIAEAINDTRAQFGLPVWSLADIRVNCTRAARDSFPEWFGVDWEKAYAVYYRRFDEVRQQAKIKPLAGAEELLCWLKSQNIPAFVVSNKRGDYLRLEVSMLGWQDLFACVIGAQDAAQDKPARDPVDLALKTSALAANDAIWFVGDSETDILCARAAGCTPVWIGAAEGAARLSVARSFSDCHALHALLYTEHNKVA